MEKWQLSEIFSVSPKPKLDLSQIGTLRKSLRRADYRQPGFSPFFWLEVTLRKLVRVIALF